MFSNSKICVLTIWAKHCCSCSSGRLSSAMMRRYGRMLTAWATILYMLMHRGASSVDVDNNSTKICRLLCSDQDAGNTGASDADRCVDGCQRAVRSIVAWKNRLQSQEKPAEGNGEKWIRNDRAWMFPDLSKWQERMLMSGIGSRSRSAGSYLRIGRDSIPETAQLGGDVERRRGRMRSAGRYLRIGRAGESADPELMASGTARDGIPEEEMADMLHLRKVNRGAPVEHDALQ